MTLRVDIKPELLHWAMERSGVDSAVLFSRFSKLGAWLERSIKPTLKQAEAFARATHTPFGFLLLPAPPEEPLPIPDFRTVANSRIARPSANLLDTIYRCQQRQYWYREYLLNHGEPARAFVGSLSLERSVTALSDADMARPGAQATEAWCNQVAAEILAPTYYLRRALRPGEHIDASLARLTRTFKVSTLVILRRLFDVGQIERNVFSALYSQELERLKNLQQKRGAGGDFYRSQPGKLSPTFARALISSAVEGRTSFRDAMRMLGVRKTSTFWQLGRQLQVTPNWFAPAMRP